MMFFHLFLAFSNLSDIGSAGKADSVSQQGKLSKVPGHANIQVVAEIYTDLELQGEFAKASLLSQLRRDVGERVNDSVTATIRSG